MQDFRRANGGQVAVALIGEHNVVRIGALDSRGHGGGAAMGGLHHIAGKVVVGHDRAAHRSYADGLTLDLQLVDYLRHQPMDDAVGAAGAVMSVPVGESVRPFKYNHVCAPPAI